MANFRQIWSHWQSHTHPYCLYFCFDGPLSLSLFYAETLSWFLLSHRTHMQGHKFIRPQKHQNSGLLTLYPILTMRFSLFLSHSLSLSLSLSLFVHSNYKYLLSLSLSCSFLHTTHSHSLSARCNQPCPIFLLLLVYFWSVCTLVGTYPTYLPSQRTDRRTEAKIPDTKFIDLSFAAFQKLDSFESD